MFYKAEITTATGKRCLFKVLEAVSHPKEWSGHLHLALAPTKNMDRIEWLAEKATEIGFDELTFSDCRYSEAQGGQDGTHRQDFGVGHEAEPQGP